MRGRQNRRRIAKQAFRDATVGYWQRWADTEKLDSEVRIRFGTED